MDELIWLPATRLVQLYRAREVSPVEMVDAVLRRLEDVNPQINAFVTKTTDSAREQARLAEHALQRAEPVGPLCGIPVTAEGPDRHGRCRYHVRSPIATIGPSWTKHFTG